MASDRRALVIGIDHYNPANFAGSASDLTSAARDAKAVAALLGTGHETNETWDVTTITDTAKRNRVRRLAVITAIKEHLAEASGDRLLYFAGHAIKDVNGITELQAYDGAAYSFDNLMRSAERASRRAAKSVTIILDCCMSGDIAGHSSGFDTLLAVVPENVSILTATRPSQRAAELVSRGGDGQGGLFTSQLIGGLQGAAADLFGYVSVFSLFAHASTGLQSTIQANGWPRQQAMFKTNTDHNVVLRRVKPRISEDALAHMPEVFATPDKKVELTEAHEGLTNDRYEELQQTWLGPGPVVDENGANHRSDPDRKEFTGSREQRALDYLKCYRNAGLVETHPAAPANFYHQMFEAKNRDDRLVWLNELGQNFWKLAKLGRFRTDA